MPATLFVALVPPPEVLAPLVEAVHRLQAQAPELGWVAPQRWHVTLCFLGRGEPSDDLRERLGRVARRHPAPSLRLDGGGRFGDRVLWAGLDGNLQALASGVSRASTRAGYPVEDRPFRAHLTLARARRTRVDLRPLAAELGAVQGPAWTAVELVLLAGAPPGPGDVPYRRVDAWPFTTVTSAG